MFVIDCEGFRIGFILFQSGFIQCEPLRNNCTHTSNMQIEFLFKTKFCQISFVLKLCHWLLYYIGVCVDFVWYNQAGYVIQWVVMRIHHDVIRWKFIFYTHFPIFKVFTFCDCKLNIEQHVLDFHKILPLYPILTIFNFVKVNGITIEFSWSF